MSGDSDGRQLRFALVVAHLGDQADPAVWGHPPGGEANETVTLVVAELAANAARHGRVRGRDFLVRLVLREDVVPVEVLDARVDRLSVPAPEPDDEGGRGLLLVAALAEESGVELRPDGVRKTVWAEVSLRTGIS